MNKEAMVFICVLALFLAAATDCHAENADDDGGLYGNHSDNDEEQMSLPEPLTPGLLAILIVVFGWYFLMRKDHK